MCVCLCATKKDEGERDNKVKKGRHTHRRRETDAGRQTQGDRRRETGAQTDTQTYKQEHKQTHRQARTHTFSALRVYCCAGRKASTGRPVVVSSIKSLRPSALAFPDTPAAAPTVVVVVLLRLEQSKCRSC